MASKIGRHRYSKSDEGDQKTGQCTTNFPRAGCFFRELLYLHGGMYEHALVAHYTYLTYFFFSFFLFHHFYFLAQRVAYPQRSSGQAVVTGVEKNKNKTGFSITTSRRFSSNVAN